MSSAYDLILFLGSPFVENNSNDLAFSDRKKKELYDLAYKNKIGLYFLDRLEKLGELSPLENIFELNMIRYTETCKTAALLTSKIKKITGDFAVFKFVKPYPHTPSDVDVLFNLSNEAYSETINKLLDDGYYKIGESPSQTVVYDLRGGYESMDRRVVNGKRGGKYYIDLYRDVSASYLIYITNYTVMDHIINYESEFGTIQTLHPLADLPIVLTHSIVPEQLFTLADYYTALSFINSMDWADMDRMLKLVRENNIIHAIAISLYLTSVLHRDVHGFVPDKIKYLLENLHYANVINKISFSVNHPLPYRHEPSLIVKVLLERMKNRIGLRSMINQMIHMGDPRLMKWVAYNIVLRRIRETY